MRIRAGAASLVLAAGLLWPVATVVAPACAGEGPRAALVVDTGESVARYCVALNEDSVSGIELIALAGEQHGLEYHLGFGGAAVCMLAGAGPTGDDCFEQYPDFWAYWRGDDGGGWTWSSSGASTTVVEDGDVEGWSWGAGDGPDSHQPPPQTELESVCKAVTPEPSGPPEPPETEPAQTGSTTASDAGQGGRAPEEESGDGGRSTTPRSEHKERRKPDSERISAVDLPPEPASPRPLARARAAPPSGPATAGGPPAAGVAGLVAAAGLIVAGAVLTRRRRSS